MSLNNPTGSSGNGNGSGGAKADTPGGSDIPALSSSSSLSEEVKMSIRNISSEITIFEIKTPLPERTVPPSHTGSTTITTINPLRTTATPQRDRNFSQGALPISSSRPQNSFLGMSNALHNKQIQLQPISHSLQQSHHRHHQQLSNRVSITPAVSQKSIPLINKPLLGQNQRTMVLNHNPNASVRVTPATFLKNRPPNNKFCMNSGKPIMVEHSDRKPIDAMEIDARLDPLTMLETKMVEGDREINTEIKHEGPKLEHRFIKPSVTSDGMQKLLAFPGPRQPLQIPQSNRRKASHVELIELRDDDEEENTNVISEDSSPNPSKNSENSDSQSKEGFDKTDSKLVPSPLPPSNPQPSPVAAPGRPRSKGKVPPRRRKRKRLFTTGRIGNQHASAKVPPAPGKRGVGRPPNNPSISTVPKTLPTPAVTSMYRTRTVVKASIAASLAEKAEQESALNPDKSMHPPKLKTMKEVLASIPGFGAGRPRKRHHRKLSTAEQLEQTKREGHIDLETPGSILTQVNLRAILNKHTFSLLPPLYQYKLIQLLPEVDAITGPDSSVKLSSSAVNNEFFARACEEWKNKLTAGEFTPEQRQKNKLEAEKERLKLDPWKVKHFEPIWGQKSVTASTSRQSKPPEATITKPIEASATATSTTQPIASPQGPTDERRQSLRSSRLSPSIIAAASSISSSEPSTSQTFSDIDMKTETEVEESISLLKPVSTEVSSDVADLEEREKSEESENSSSNEQEDDSCARTKGISSIKKSVPPVSITLSLGKRAGEVDNVDKTASVAKKFKTAESSEVSSSQASGKSNEDEKKQALTNLADFTKMDATTTAIAAIPNTVAENTVSSSEISQLQKSDLGLSLKDVTICEVKADVGKQFSNIDFAKSSKEESTVSVSKVLLDIKVDSIQKPDTVSILPVVDGSVKLETTRICENKVDSVMKDISYVTHSSDLVIIPCTSDAKPLSISETSKVLNHGITTELPTSLSRELPPPPKLDPDSKIPCSISLQVPLSSIAPVAVGTGATLLPIPSGNKGTLQKGDMKSMGAVNNSTNHTPGQLNNDNGMTGGNDRSKTKDEVPACLIPPEIKNILPASLTVVHSDPNRILPKVKIEATATSDMSQTLNSAKAVSVKPTSISVEMSNNSMPPNQSTTPSVSIVKSSAQAFVSSQSPVITNTTPAPSSTSKPSLNVVSTNTTVNVGISKAIPTASSQDLKPIVTSTVPAQASTKTAVQPSFACSGAQKIVSSIPTPTYTGNTTMLTADVSIKPATTEQVLVGRKSVADTVTISSGTKPITFTTTSVSSTTMRDSTVPSTQSNNSNRISITNQTSNQENTGKPKDSLNWAYSISTTSQTTTTASNVTVVANTTSVSKTQIINKSIVTSAPVNENTTGVTLPSSVNISAAKSIAPKLTSASGSKESAQGQNAITSNANRTSTSKAVPVSSQSNVVTVSQVGTITHADSQAIAVTVSRVASAPNAISQGSTLKVSQACSTPNAISQANTLTISQACPTPISPASTVAVSQACPLPIQPNMITISQASPSPTPMSQANTITVSQACSTPIPISLVKISQASAIPSTVSHMVPATVAEKSTFQIPQTTVSFSQVSTVSTTQPGVVTFRLANPPSVSSAVSLPSITSVSRTNSPAVSKSSDASNVSNCIAISTMQEKVGSTLTVSPSIPKTIGTATVTTAAPTDNPGTPRSIATNASQTNPTSKPSTTIASQASVSKTTLASLVSQANATSVSTPTVSLLVTAQPGRHGVEFPNSSSSSPRTTPSIVILADTPKLGPSMGSIQPKTQPGYTQQNIVITSSASLQPVCTSVSSTLSKSGVTAQLNMKAPQTTTTAANSMAEKLQNTILVAQPKISSASGIVSTSPSIVVSSAHTDTAGNQNKVLVATPVTGPTNMPVMSTQKSVAVTSFHVATSQRPQIQVTASMANTTSVPTSPALIRVQKAVSMPMPLQPQQSVQLVTSTGGPMSQAPKTLTLVSQGGKPLKTAILVSQSATNQIINQTSMKNPRTANNPPGQINLERSYQICKAVIQNSPNREHLQNQLMKPTNVNTKVDLNRPTTPNIQGHQLTSNIGDMIQIQRRTTAPTIIQTPLASSSVPILGGVSPHQKVIVAHITGPPGTGSPGQLITHSSCPNAAGNMQQSTSSSVMPLIRPVQPGSPIIVRPAGSTTSHMMVRLKIIVLSMLEVS
ncbi:unnamed protein product [Orchesella dallaii]|uniref:DEUBAD domain-containing protein n=1 Tax=Orchesella dallaii TaxID=48710 RepID=A0ABP1QBR0_9HEXA